MSSSMKWEQLAQFSPQRDTALTIGVFDGVHLGHRHLIGQMVELARDKGLLSLVVTFRCHPLRVLYPETTLGMLMSLDERICLIREVGADIVVPISFNRELSNSTAREFVLNLKEYLRMKAMVIGPDFALGRGREGNSHVLRSLGEEMDFTVDMAFPVSLNGDVVSSTAIRGFIAQGQIAKARSMLGHGLFLHGRVVHGEARGRTLGFPTANLSVDPIYAVPANGVYATLALLGDRSFASVTNIGNRPTFNGNERSIEVYLMDFDGCLYDCEMRLELIEYLRGERRFSSPEELTLQISRDVTCAREVLQSEKAD